MDASTLQRKGYSIAALRSLARRRLSAHGIRHGRRRRGRRDHHATQRGGARCDRVCAETPRPARRSAIKRSKSLGVKLPSPVIIGKTGLAGTCLAACRTRDGARVRRASARSTRRATLRPRPSRRSALRRQGPKWMQVFLYKDRGITADFAARAAASSYKGLVAHRRQSDDRRPRSRRPQRNQLSLSVCVWGGPSSISQSDRAGSCGWRKLRSRPSSTTARAPRSALSVR